ncbi:MAG: DNA recombination protein RmuC [Paracoccaceae bacterium]
MIVQILEIIQSNPDWVLYGLGVLVLLMLALLIWRRADRLRDAQDVITSQDMQLETLEGHAVEQAQILAELREEIVRLETTLAHHKETEGTLKTQFTNLANEVMRSQRADFKRENEGHLTQVLQPLKEHITRFETELREVHKSADKDRVALKSEISNLMTQSLQVSEEAHNLTQALKGDTQKQGAWGEMILASILESSGLQEGTEYETQAHHRNEDGAALRPDVIVNLPGGRKLVIDSKVSLTAYERAVNAENPDARAVAMDAHITSIKGHINGLSDKKYGQVDDGAIDYVIMFMPIESAFSEAVRADSKLMLHAAKKNVIIATPNILMLALKTVENLWSVEKRNKNALEIAKRAGLLYDKFHGFVEDMDKIGTQLNTVQTTHAKAVSKLKDGQGNLHFQVEDLKKLGARASKQLDVETPDTPHLPEPDEGA